MQYRITFGYFFEKAFFRFFIAGDVQTDAWSADLDTYVEVDFSKISSDMEVYAWYGEPDPYVLKAEQVVEVLHEGFAEEGKYITDDFQLPYANHFGVFNMLSSAEYKGLDITWTINSGVLAQSVNMSGDYIVDVPSDILGEYVEICSAEEMNEEPDEGMSMV